MLWRPPFLYSLIQSSFWLETLVHTMYIWIHRPLLTTA